MEQQIQAVESEARRCQALVQDLLIFSRLEKGPKEETDINQVVSGALKLIQAQAKVTKVQIIQDFDLT